MLKRTILCRIPGSRWLLARDTITFKDVEYRYTRWQSR